MNSAKRTQNDKRTQTHTHIHTKKITQKKSLIQKSLIHSMPRPSTLRRGQAHFELTGENFTHMRTHTTCKSHIQTHTHIIYAARTHAQVHVKHIHKTHGTPIVYCVRVCLCVVVIEKSERDHRAFMKFGKIHLPNLYSSGSASSRVAKFHHFFDSRTR